MNENLDLTEILKDCPKGTELYSTIYGEVKFIRIDNKSIDYPIDFNTLDGYTISLTSDGRCIKSYDGECVLFPSKDQRDWSKWHRPFVDGDVVYAKVYDLSYIIIYHKQIDERVYRHACLCLETDMFGCDKDCIFTDDPIDEWRLATEEEKQKLFDVIKDKGYRWNADTKKLKKIEPKFDVSTLRPFDKVLCRMNDDDIWGISLFERYIPTNPYPFFCIQDTYNQCIPYNDETIHLLGTTQQVSDKYINW